MIQLSKLLVHISSSVKDVIETIESNAMQIAIIIDDNRSLQGVVTDGDLRRGILKGVSLTDSAIEVMNRNPIYCEQSDTREHILAIMQKHSIRHVPVVDTLKRVVRIETFESYYKPPEKDNWVVLMAGGLGTRLYPLTENCPKPLLKVGGKPVLETIMENLITNGFRNFYLSVNYRADMVHDYFGDGSKWGVQIRYIYENKRLGTAGALSLIPDVVKDPIIVMNGDLLTKVNFQQMLDFHNENRSEATMAVREYEFQVPYGVVKVDKHRLKAIVEKPIQHYFVSAGIYVLNPDVLSYIPENTFYDMPSLFERLIEMNRETTVFPVREYWLDIGRMDDLERANVEYKDVFG